MFLKRQLCLLVLCGVLAWVSSVEAKHYLFSPVYHSSHWRPQLAIAQEVAARGNKVTFILQEEFEGVENPSRERISFAEEVILYKSGYSPEIMQEACKKMAEMSSYSLESITFGMEFMKKMSDAWISSFKSVYALVETGKYDVFIADVDPMSAAICGLTNITCALSSPFVLRGPDSEAFVLGHGLPPWFPFSAMGYGLATSFEERLRNQILISFTKSLFFLLRPQAVVDYIESIGLPSEKLYEPFPVMINTFQGLDWNIPVAPHVKFIGPTEFDNIELAKLKSAQRHEAFTQAISEGKSREQADLLAGNSQLFSWIEQHDSIVVISFGKSVELSSSQIEVLVGFVAKWEKPVLWSVRKHQLSSLPKQLPANLRVETWIDFVEVVSHPHVRLVVSQCGVSTAHETILAQAPLLCVPILFDQFDISVLVQYRRVGETVLKDAWNPEVLYKVASDMIANEEFYVENSKPLLELARRRPSIAKVVDWIETIDEVGQEYFVPPVNMRRARFYEYYELYYLLALLFGALCSILTCCLMKGCCFCCCCGSKAKSSKQKLE